jgi:hypothetical protein
MRLLIRGFLRCRSSSPTKEFEDSDEHRECFYEDRPASSDDFFRSCDPGPGRAGQTLGASPLRRFAAQFGGTGTAHPVTGDTWTVNYTTGGTARTQSGGF